MTVQPFGPANLRPPADTVEKLAPVRTTRNGRIVQRTNMDAKLARIRQGACIAGSEKSKHAAIPGVGHVIGAVSGREDKLCSRTQTKRSSRLCQTSERRRLFDHRRWYREWSRGLPTGAVN